MTVPIEQINQITSPHSERAHAKYPPSGTDRWIECPGSVILSEGIASEPSIYADEGTAAHEECEKAAQTGEITTLDVELHRCITIYLAELNSIRARKPVFEWIETTAHHATLPDYFGTADYVAAYQDGEDFVLHFVDYKHGKGVPVDAEENKQLLSYALILSSKFPPGTFTKYRVTVVQPRAFNHDAVSHWECDQSRLDQHDADVRAAMQSNVVKAGSHCRWCPAAATCTAFRERAMEIAQAEFPEIITEPEVSNWLAMYAMKEAIASVLESLEAKLVAAAMRGVKLPGFKVCESYSHRQWKFEEAETLKKLGKFKIGKKQATKTVLLTPAQLEESGADKAVVASLCETKLKGYRVISESTRGKAVNFQVAATEEFTEVAN